MVEHHIQKNIVKSLVIHDSARFADIKPKDVDGNIFTYHLQQLIKQKFIEKRQDGRYELTASGKAIGINSALTAQELLEQAHPIILIAVRNGDDWLLRKRLTQPAYGMFGFVHTEPSLYESAATTAMTALEFRTGIKADCVPRGSGYVRIFKNDQMESFTQFTLFEARNLQGEMRQSAPTGENIWLKSPDFKDKSMVPSMHDLCHMLETSDGQFYTDLTYHL